MDRKIVIGHLFKEQSNLYGDAGNVDVLKKRLKERNIKAEVLEYSINDNIEFDKLDIIYIGGGRNREKRLVIDCLRDWLDEFRTYIEKGGVLLVTGSSLSMFGRICINQDNEIPGLGILDLATEKIDQKIEGHCSVDSVIDGKSLSIIGYRNLDEKYLHIYNHLGVVDVDDHDGLINKHVIATSLHGPVLAKNKDLADILIKWAYEKKYGNFKMTSLNDNLENKFRKLVEQNNV